MSPVILPRDAEATTMQASRVPAGRAGQRLTLGSVCLSGLLALGSIPDSTLHLFCYSFSVCMCACVLRGVCLFLVCVSTLGGMVRQVIGRRAGM